MNIAKLRLVNLQLSFKYGKDVLNQQVSYLSFLERTSSYESYNLCVLCVKVVMKILKSLSLIVFSLKYLDKFISFLFYVSQSDRIFSPKLLRK